MRKQRYSSANTSINSKKLPAIYTLRSNDLREKEIIDIGGGKYDIAKEWGRANGADVNIYDPYNRSEEENAHALNRKGYDVSIISNVLNVIYEPEIRRNLVVLATEKSPITYITVYEGDKSGVGRVSQEDCWQENRKTKDYVAEIQSYVPDMKVTRRGKVIEIRVA